jgi:hypothetical protein
VAALALRDAPQPRRLRIGVFADTPLQPRWVAEAFARLAAADFAEVTLVEPGVEGAGAEPAARLASAIAQLAGVESVPASLLAGEAALPALWRLYARLDRRLFGADDEPSDLRACLRAHGGGELDVAFALGALDDAALDGRARYGVWRFCFGPQGADAESLAGAPEVAREDTLTASGIKVRLSRDEPARLAYQSCSRTYPFSVARNRDHLRKTGEFALRAMRELHRSGEAWLRGCKPLHAGTAARGVAATDALRIGARLARRAVQKALAVEQWFIAFAFASRLEPGLGGFTRLMPPRDRDWADPFPLEHNGRHFIFFEEVPFASRKGHISVVEVDRAGRVSAPLRVLERDYHLSYPFVFEHGGSLYMIPESAANATVELWRCVEFPARWRHEANLMQGVRCVDATLHRAGGRWWMFANCAAGGSELYDDELSLFSAERLTGDWRPHPRNPVKSDPRGSRPAGRLFLRNGALYRPAQICVPRYGAGLAVQRVLKLGEQEYEERTVERIVPAASTGLLGLHTLNHAGSLTVVDAFVRRRRF